MKYPILLLASIGHVLLFSNTVVSVPTFWSDIREKFAHASRWISSKPLSSSFEFLDKSVLPSIPPALENDNGPLDLTIIHTNDIHSHLSLSFLEKFTRLY
ncbi:hypothetical protein BKA69DRAFT_1108383 [Paraphysoderma sedebokerense]|nr:hypothetical protein BKA69DRAFT_1108383 [Paraphysoderma sedebokerense]